MKTIKFQSSLVPLILSGQKTSTWRLFDDKNLSTGDVIALQEFGQVEPFAKAKIEEVVAKPLGQLTSTDKVEHEPPFKSNDEMYEIFSGYYDSSVGPETIVKIVRFNLL